MKTRRHPLISVIMLSAMLTACQDGGPVELDLQELSLEDLIALELLADPATTETALELAGVQASAALRHGWSWGSRQAQQSQAEQCFREARAALAAGDQIRAVERAREGRRLVAQTIASAGGPQAIVGMVERVEALPLLVSADAEDFVNPGELGLQLGKVAERARDALKAGDQTRAGSLGVLAEQAFRHSHRHQHMHQVGLGISRAELAVALGGKAIDLAKRILDDEPTADSESQEMLDTAEEFLEAANEALEAGEEARAIHLAHLAKWWALKAVVLPGGITDEEARSILELAETLLAEARLAVGPEPTQLQEALLSRAARLLERGTEALDNGVCRGMGALWQSAVISFYLIG